MAWVIHQAVLGVTPPVPLRSDNILSHLISYQMGKYIKHWLIIKFSFISSVMTGVIRWELPGAAGGVWQSATVYCVVARILHWTRTPLPGYLSTIYPVAWPASYVRLVGNINYCDIMLLPPSPCLSPPACYLVCSFIAALLDPAMGAAEILEREIFSFFTKH